MIRPGHARSHRERGACDRSRTPGTGRARRSVSALLATVIVAGTLSGALVVATATQAGASTIVTETFANATASSASWVSGGTGGTNVACLTAGSSTTQTPIPGCGGTTDAAGSGALRLTTNGTDQTGWALYNSAVAAASGLNISFNTFQFDGTGADGISFFLVPGTTSLTAPGSFGGYLGYGGGGTGSPTGTDGVTNGLLNVGLDVYGNNAWTGYDGANCAAGSTSSFPLSAAGEPTASVPESVTVRGPGNGLNGYCYIANSGNLTTANAAHALDYPKATKRASTNTVGVNIVVPPPNATGTPPNVTITLTFPNGDTYVQTAAEPPASFLPTTFKFGFAGSSGSSTEIHEINDLTVTTSIPNPGVTSVSPAQTAVGTTKNVTITGINFNNATGVTVGGVAATNVVVVSNTEITATVPANATAGVYDTLVTGPGGTSSVNSGDKFTYGSSTTSLVSSSNPSVVGQTVTYTATAASSTASASSVVPTGNIEFLDNGTPVSACGGSAGVAVNGSGVATCAQTYTAPGSHPLTAVYLGDTNYTGSTSTVVTQTVNKATTSTTLASSANPSILGQAVTFTGTVAPVAPGAGTPTGNIEFLQGGTAIAACGGSAGVAVNGSGQATCAVTYNATGTYAITATYLGDANFATSTATAVSQVVTLIATTTTVASSVNPSVVGQPVTFTGTVAVVAPGTGTPTGNIEFLQGGTAIAACGGSAGVAVNGSGQATCAVTYNATGTYAITATYLGSAAYATSTSTATSQVVNKAATTTAVASSVNPSVVGQPVTFTGTVAVVAPGTGTPTGNIEFLQGGTAIAACGGSAGVAVNGSGQATCAVTYNATGTYAITATYLGSAAYATSTSTATSQVVNKAATTTAVASSVNPSVVGQPVTFTGTVAVVAPGTGTPTGNIEFLQGGTAIAACGGSAGVAVNGSGQATCAVTYNATGTYAITATYLGSAAYATSTSTATSQVVNKAATTTAVASSVNPSVVGQPVTFTGTVAVVAPGTGTPTGNIEFLQGGTAIAACGGSAGVAVNGSGQATCAVTYNATGTYAITATYLGSAAYATSTSTATSQVVNKAATTTTVASSVNPSVTGQTVVYTGVSTTVAPGSGTPTGNIEFLDGGTPIATCGGATGAPVNGAGQAICTVSYPATGTHAITAVSLGDAGHSASTSTTLGQVVDQAASLTTLASSANPSTVGQSVTFTAATTGVAPGAGTPTGNIEFLDNGTPIAACGGAAGAPVDGSGQATCETTYASVSTHPITAVELGDANFTGSTSPTVDQAVGMSATTTSIASSVNPSVAGQGVTYSSTVTPAGAGTPTGFVEFLDGGSPIADCNGATGEPLNGSGTATCATSYAGAGSHAITAVYLGDTNFVTSSSSVLAQTVDPAASSTTLTSGTNPSVAGQSVTFTAVTTAAAPGSGTPTGNVEFLDGGTPIADCGGATGEPVDGTGTATCTTSFASVGTDAVTATELGDANFTPSTSAPVAQTVDPAASSTTLTSGTNPSVAGQSVTFTAVTTAAAPGSGTPTGNVEFLDGGTPIADCGGATGEPVDGTGTATCTTSFASVGTDAVTATELGDANFTPSTSAPVAQTVDPAASSTTLTSGTNPSVAGQSVTFTAVTTAAAPGSGTPTGNVEFLDGGTPIADCGGATGEPVDGTGTATCTTSFASVGTDAVTATELGDANFTPSTSAPVAQTVDPAASSTTLTSGTNPSVAGQSVTFTAVTTAAAPGSGTPTGNVEFLDGGTPIADCGGATGEPVDGTGTATCVTSYATSGSHQITATELGDTNFTPSTSAPVTQTVDALPSSVTASASPTTTVFGQNTTITATVPAAATGTVTFTGPGDATLCTATVSDGTATCDTTALPVGADSVDVSYSGDATYGPSSTTTSVTVSQAGTTTTVVSSDNPVTAGDGVTYTAAVSATAPGAGTPTGFVVFLDGSTPIAACNSDFGVPLTGSAEATCTTSYFVAGSHTITASYQGDTDFTGSVSGPLTQLVEGIATSVSASASPSTTVFGQNTTITATVPAAATGTVTFTGPGDAVLCTAPVTDGSATCDTTALPVGSDTVQVSYSGDGTYVPSSTFTTVTVDQAATTTSLSSSGSPSTAGDPVTLTAVAGPVAPGAGTLTGSIEFLSGGQPIAACGGASGQPVDGTGTATCATSFPVAGTFTLTATYLGDTDFTGSTSGPLPQVVNPIATSVTASASPSTTVSGQDTTITATVPTGATGTVTFTGPGDTVLCIATVSDGTATCDTTALPVGTDTVEVSYSGDATYGSSSTSASVTVSPAGTTSTVTSSADPANVGQTVTFTDTVSPLAPGSGTPTGEVTFSEGGNPVPTCTDVPLVGGVATCALTFGSAGQYVIGAGYPGDTEFNGSGAAPLTQVISTTTSTTAASASPSTTVFGQGTTITATVPAAATGSVVFTGPGDVTLCTATVSDGTATCDTTVLPVGTDTVGVAYLGDPTYGPSSTTTSVTVTKAGTTTAVISSINPSVAGGGVTYTASVAPVAPGAGAPPPGSSSSWTAARPSAGVAVPLGWPSTVPAPPVRSPTRWWAATPSPRCTWRTPTSPAPPRAC